MHGIGLLDFVNRRLDPITGQFTQVDQHAESYYDLSPYMAMAGNPVRNVDPMGMDYDDFQQDWPYIDIDFPLEGGWLPEVTVTAEREYPKMEMDVEYPEFDFDEMDFYYDDWADPFYDAYGWERWDGEHVAPDKNHENNILEVVAAVVALTVIAFDDVTGVGAADKGGEKGDVSRKRYK